MERVVAALEDIGTELSALNEHVQELTAQSSDANKLTNSWGRTVNVALAAIAEAVGAE